MSIRSDPDRDSGDSRRPIDQLSSDLDTAESCIPARLSVTALQQAEQQCRGCALFRHATQAVGGEGSPTARIMLVGEAPGDQEDLQGHPFVGPAGKLLNEMLKSADISRKDVFVTNAVKHFKWEAVGKRRLHAKPNARELSSCRPWLDSEIKLIQPKMIICLGATAAQELIGRQFRLTSDHGRTFVLPIGNTMATYHPAAILRTPDRDAREKMKSLVIHDLSEARRILDH